jgi:hypothetical protein
MPALGVAIPWQFSSQIPAKEEIGKSVKIRKAGMKVRANTPLTAH